jgi:hypothetical protein
MTKSYRGELEIDHERGVIYFHLGDTGISLLRICQLPTPIPKNEMLDIALGVGTSWAPLPNAWPTSSPVLTTNPEQKPTNESN